MLKQQERAGKKGLRLYLVEHDTYGMPGSGPIMTEAIVAAPNKKLAIDAATITAREFGLRAVKTKLSCSELGPLSTELRRDQIRFDTPDALVLCIGELVD